MNRARNAQASDSQSQVYAML